MNFCGGYVSIAENYPKWKYEPSLRYVYRELHSYNVTHNNLSRMRCFMISLTWFSHFSRVPTRSCRIGSLNLHKRAEWDLLAPLYRPRLSRDVRTRVFGGVGRELEVEEASHRTGAIPNKMVTEEWIYVVWECREWSREQAQSGIQSNTCTRLGMGEQFVSFLLCLSVIDGLLFRIRSFPWKPI